jgi:hypothetical protein
MKRFQFVTLVLVFSIVVVSSVEAQSKRSQSNRLVTYSASPDELAALHSALSSNPSPAQIGRAVECLARGEAKESRSALLLDVQRLLIQGQHRDQVLAALGAFSVRDLEPSLLRIVPADASSLVADKALLQALRVSGSIASTLRLAALLRQEHDRVHSNTEALEALATELSNEDDLLAATEFFSVLKSGSFLVVKPADAVIASQLSTALDRIAARKQISYLLVPATSFLRANAKTVPFICDKAGSSRNLLLRAIQNALMKDRAVSSLLALTLFADCDDPEIAGRAESADYSQLKQNAWLAPWSWSGTFGLWLSHGLSDDPQHTALPSRAMQLLQSLKLDCPDDLGFLPRLARYTFKSTDNASQQRLASAVFSGTAAAAADIVKEIDRDYALSILPLDTPPDIALGFFGKPEDTPYVLDDFVTNEIDSKLGVDDITTLADTKKPSHRAMALFLTRNELFRRALVAYALFRYSRTVHTPIPTTVADLDSTFESIADKAGVASPMASTFDPRMQYFGTSDLTSCATATVAVTRRRVVLNMAVYQEHLVLTCREGNAVGTKVEGDWSGTIPLGLLPALRTHTRLFDLMGISLGTREWKQLTSKAVEIEDLTLLREQPLIAILLFTAAARHPDVDPSEIRNTLLSLRDPNEVETLRPSLPFIPGLLPLDDPIGPTVQIEDEAPYVKQVESLKADVEASLNKRFMRMIGQQILPAIQALPDTVSHSYPTLCSDGHSTCGTSSSQGTNNGKFTLLNQVIGAMNSARDVNLFREFQLSSSRCGTVSRTQFIDEYIKEDFTRIAAAYSYSSSDQGGCTAVVEMPLTADPDMQLLLKRFANTESKMFDRYRLDLGGGTLGSRARLLTVLDNFDTEDERVATAYSLLKSNLELPFVAFPAPSDWYDWERIDRSRLLSSASGMEAAMRLNVLAQTRKYLAGPALPNLGQADQSFFDPLIQRYSELEAQAQHDADTKVHAALNALAQSKAQGFQIGVSISWTPLPILGVGVEIGDFGLNLSMSSGASILRGAFRGINIPVSLDVSLMPATHAPGGGALPESNSIAVDPDLAPARLASTASGLELISGGARSVETVPAPEWTIMPPIDSGKVGYRDDPSTRSWLAGLVKQAWPKLTEAEKTHVQDGLKQAKFPEALVDTLVERRNQAVEAEKIESGEWVDTHVVDQLIPEKRPGTGCPPAGCVNMDVPSDVDKYIASRNKEAKDAFDGAVWEAKARCGHSDIFKTSSGLPATSITYGNDFKVMLFEYRFQIIDGSVLTWDFYQRTPLNLIYFVKKDPNGHELEKWDEAIASQMQSFAASGGPSKALFDTVEAKQELEVADKIEALHQATDANVEALAKDLQESIKNFFAEIEAYFEREQKSGAVDPFLAPYLASPLLDFYAPPFACFERRDDKLQEIFLYERASDLYYRVGTGGLILK